MLRRLHLPVPPRLVPCARRHLCPSGSGYATTTGTAARAVSTTRARGRTGAGDRDQNESDGHEDAGAGWSWWRECWRPGVLALAGIGGGVMVAGWAPADADAGGGGGAGDNDDLESLRLIPLTELRAHTGAAGNGCWVSYGNIVYDATPFLRMHPGGVDSILMAGGQALENFWVKYPVHMSRGLGIELLEKLPRVGRLSDDDVARARSPHDPENANHPNPAVRRRGAAYLSAVQLHAERVRAVTWVAVVAPVWHAVCLLLKIVGFALPFVAHAAARRLPVALPGYGRAAPIGAVAADGTRRRVAVVGGGAAGVGAAYTLAKAGYDVTVYEAHEALGGNAQAHTFTVDPPGGARPLAVKQDVAHLTWAPEYAQNYTNFLHDLGLPAVEVAVPFVLRTNRLGGATAYFTPAAPAAEPVAAAAVAGLTSIHSDKSTHSAPLATQFAPDIARFESMVAWCRRVTSLFCLGDASPSAYKAHNGLLAGWNPLHYVTTRRAAALFGVSDDFYEGVVRPVYGGCVGTTEIDELPAVAWPVLRDTAPLHTARAVMTWGRGTSEEVFERATAGCKVKREHRVLVVKPDEADASKLKVITDRAMRKLAKPEVYDRVILACPSHAAANIVKCERGAAGAYEDAILRGVGYLDDYTKDDWMGWLEVPVHQDALVLPQRHRHALLNHAGCFIDDDAGGGGERGVRNVQYTNILGGLCPSVDGDGVRGADAPMFLTRSPHADETIDAGKEVGVYTAPKSLPDVSWTTRTAAACLRLVQGRHGVYYCANYVTPATRSPDTSFLSGVAAACAVGAAYPFPEDAAAAADFRHMRGFMGV